MHAIKSSYACTRTCALLEASIYANARGRVLQSFQLISAEGFEPMDLMHIAPTETSPSTTADKNEDIQLGRTSATVMVHNSIHWLKVVTRTKSVLTQVTVQVAHVPRARRQLLLSQASQVFGDCLQPHRSVVGPRSWFKPLECVHCDHATPLPNSAHVGQTPALVPKASCSW